jgi:hypothetical protein
MMEEGERERISVDMKTISPSLIINLEPWHLLPSPTRDEVLHRLTFALFSIP